jgi:hypothetical protein
METGLIPIKALFKFLSSLDKTQKRYKQTNINPKLLSVLMGSLKIPSETLSHHLDASPIKLTDSADWIKPKALKIKKIIRNINEIKHAT